LIERVHHDPDPWKQLRDDRGDGEAVSTRKDLVDDEDFRTELFAEGEALASILRDADALHVALSVDEVTQILAN